MNRLIHKPKLCAIEKDWIIYQILKILEKIESEKIYHGDLKAENILLTSYLGVQLSDFASYKPDYVHDVIKRFYRYF